MRTKNKFATEADAARLEGQAKGLMMAHDLARAYGDE